MSTPERRSDRAGSRRNPDQQQLSPFRRAYLESHHSEAFDASKIPSPSKPYSPRHPHGRNFSQTRTLRGAFEAASNRYSTMPEDENFPSAPYTFGSPNRKRRQNSNPDPLSPESNPPTELADTYRQISDAGSLVDEAPENDNFHNHFLANRSRRSSSGSARREHDLFGNGSEASFLNDFTDESLRRKVSDHARDEQRLRRATANRSPVLNMNGSAAALTSENLQRREEEEKRNEVVKEEAEEEDNGFKPGLNLPSTWGSRSRQRSPWLRTITQSNASKSERDDSEAKIASPPKFKSDLDTQAGPPRTQNAGNRSALREPPSNRYNRQTGSDASNKITAEQQDIKPAGDPIPNTPIMVYKNSTFNKRSPTKRDSQDLLRKLSRTESPKVEENDLRTPDVQKNPGRRIYDQTPVVTGAWIDTPVTERPKIPDNLVKDTGSSAAPNNRSDDSLKATEPLGNPKFGNTLSPSKRDRESKSSEDEENEKKPQVSSDKDEKQAQRTKTKQKVKQPLVKPDLPKSALETVMEDFRTDKESLDVGDDTIESLQEILNDKPNGLKTEEEDDAAYQKSVLEKLALANLGHRDVDFDRLNEKLQSLADNIKEVKTGLNNIEKQVSRDADTLSLPPSPTGSQNTTTTEICGTCHNHSDSWIYTLLCLPRLWKRDPVSRRTRPTRLGWATLIFFIWFCSESTMCDYYCHPSVSNVCKGNCLNPDAPVFPVVIPTMLWRWSHLSTLLAPAWAILLAFFKLMAQLLGFWDGYVDDTEPLALNLTGEIWIRGKRVDGLIPGLSSSSSAGGGFFGSSPKQESKPVPEAVPELNLGQVVADDGSMDDDEYVE